MCRLTGKYEDGNVMIRNLYIVHESGVCLYHLDFTEYKTAAGKCTGPTDPQLISGFFTAIIAFGETTVRDTEKGFELNFISFKNHSYYFCRIRQFFIILETDAVETTLTNESISEIMQMVANLYQKYIDDGIFDENGCIYNPDDNFENEIKSFISKIMRRSLFKKISNN
jgi:hypothetical protein